MCVKCGINTCGGCSGKTSQFLTGQSFYDGADVPCLGDYGFVSGDNLNTILQNIGTVACANKAYVDNQNLNLYVNSNDTPQALLPVSGSFDYKIGDHYFVIPEDGEYEISADVIYTLSGTGGSTNIKTTFYFGVANPQLAYGFSYQYSVELVNLTADMTQSNSVHMQASSTMTAGTVIELVSIGLAAGSVGTMSVVASNIIIKKLS